MLTKNSEEKPQGRVLARTLAENVETQRLLVQTGKGSCRVTGPCSGCSDPN